MEGRGSWPGRVSPTSSSRTELPLDEALASAGIEVVAEREVLVQRLEQDVPGQLGLLTRRMAEDGVNIEVLYSDHDRRLILVVDDLVRGRRVSEAWARERPSR